MLIIVVEETLEVIRYPRLNCYNYIKFCTGMFAVIVF